MIAEGETAEFLENRTERFKFYLNEETNTIIFLEHDCQRH